MAKVIKGYTPATSSNLPCVDLLMLGRFISSNKNAFSPSEYQNISNSQESYGDEAVTFVQLKRKENLCTVKCMIRPEQTDKKSKSFKVTMVVDEQNESVTSMECHDCVHSKGTCKHALAFLIWVHRESEQPMGIERKSYWGESNRTTIKQGRKRKLIDDNDIESATMSKLVFKYNMECCDEFLEKVTLTDSFIKKIEEETRGQNQNQLWHKLRAGRITASIAFQVNECGICDDTRDLVSSIMGRDVEDNYAMKRGRDLKDTVRKTVCQKLGKRFEKCGLLISRQYPILGGSPDGICGDSIISIKGPMSARSTKNFLKYGKPADKYYTQMQILMYLTGKKKCYFCVASWDYESNKEVDIVPVDYCETEAAEVVNNLVVLWKINAYRLLQ